MSATGSITDSAGRPSLIRLAKVEGRKMVDTRAGLWLLIVTALAAVGGTLGQSLGGDVSDQRAVDVFFTNAVIVSFLLPVVGILLVTSEWSQRTGLITFALVPVRGRIVAAKLIAAIGVAIVAAAICLALGLLGGSVFGSGTEIDLSEIGRGTLFLAISVSIGVALGLAFMNSPLAIVVYFVGPILVAAIGAISESINDVTVWLDQSGLITMVETSPSGVEWDRVGVIVLAWVVLPLAAGMLRLQRGDVD